MPSPKPQAPSGQLPRQAHGITTEPSLPVDLPSCPKPKLARWIDGSMDHWITGSLDHSSVPVGSPLGRRRWTAKKCLSRSSSRANACEFGAAVRFMQRQWPWPLRRKTPPAIYTRPCLWIHRSPRPQCSCHNWWALQRARPGVPPTRPSAIGLEGSIPPSGPSPTPSPEGSWRTTRYACPACSLLARSSVSPEHKAPSVRLMIFKKHAQQHPPKPRSHPSMQLEAL